MYQTCRHLTITKNAPNLAVTLNGCDWVGSLCSTVLYDALLYQKPIWQFYQDGWPELADNWRCGLAKRICSQNELSEMVGRVLDHSVETSTDEGQVARVFSNHRQAGKTIAEFVHRKLGKFHSIVNRVCPHN